MCPVRFLPRQNDHFILRLKGSGSNLSGLQAETVSNASGKAVPCGIYRQPVFSVNKGTERDLSAACYNDHILPNAAATTVQTAKAVCGVYIQIIRADKSLTLRHHVPKLCDRLICLHLSVLLPVAPIHIFLIAACCGDQEAPFLNCLKQNCLKQQINYQINAVREISRADFFVRVFRRNLSSAARYGSGRSRGAVLFYQSIEASSVYS